MCLLSRKNRQRNRPIQSMCQRLLIKGGLRSTATPVTRAWGWFPPGGVHELRLGEGSPTGETAQREKERDALPLEPV